MKLFQSIYNYQITKLPNYLSLLLLLEVLYFWFGLLFPAMFATVASAETSAWLEPWLVATSCVRSAWASGAVARADVKSETGAEDCLRLLEFVLLLGMLLRGWLLLSRR